MLTDTRAHLGAVHPRTLMMMVIDDNKSIRILELTMKRVKQLTHIPTLDNTPQMIT